MAFTGGCTSIVEQKQKGGNPNICTIFKYSCYLFENDDVKLADLAMRCHNGEILCGECKMRLAEKINTFLDMHREKRENAKDVIGSMTYDGFKW